MAAAQTFKDIQDRTLDILSKNDLATRTRVKNHINLGYHDFVTRELWPFREVTDNIVTIAGTQEYTLTTEFADIDRQNIVGVAIQGDNQTRLTYLPFNQARISRPDLDYDGTDVPRFYYLKAGKIGFWPSPAEAYTIDVDYYKVPTELSSDTDEPIIPISYREALIHYALSFEHDYNTDYEAAIKSMNRYEQIVTLARNNLLAQPADVGGFTILGPADFKNHTDIGV